MVCLKLGSPLIIFNPGGFTNQKIMKRKILTTAALVCSFIFFEAVIANAIDGNWTGILKIDGHDYTINYYFKIEGDRVTGTSYQDQDEPKDINTGKIAGNDFTFSFSNRDGETFPMTGRYYADGDSIAININDEGTSRHLRLKRVAGN